jgi:hypothetical protein
MNVEKAYVGPIADSRSDGAGTGALLGADDEAILLEGDPNTNPRRKMVVGNEDSRPAPHDATSLMVRRPQADASPSILNVA